MWFLGLIGGLILGGLTGGGSWAVFGAFVGAVVGWGGGRFFHSGGSAEKTAAPEVEARLGLLQKAVEDIHWRLQRLEKQSELAGSPMQTQASADVVNSISADAIASPAVPAEPWGKASAPLTMGETIPAVSEASAAIKPALAEMSDDVTAPPRPVEPPMINIASTPNPLWAWMTGGNTIVRVGVLILFIGVAFLVKYAAEHSMFPIELRLASVAAGAVALLVVGWRLRLNPDRSGYALTLQGAGIAILYLTVFAALRLYSLVPVSLAFPLLVGVAAFSALLAIRQDAMALAVVGVAGGFLAPILASSGGGSHVMLFSYYAVLNAGIFFTAAYKAWRPLNLLGFVFTFVIGLVWGGQFYKPDYFSTTEPFLVLFFVAYVVIAVMYAFKQAPRLTHYVDGTLIFGVPIVGFGLQAGLVKEMEFGLAFSSLALAAFYLLLATWLNRKMQPQLKLLIESFLALGVIFATLTIPLALDASWTSAAWALEGAAVYWVGVRQDRKLARAFGLLLQALAGVAFFNSWQTSANDYVVFNRQFIGAVLLAGSGLFLNRLINRHAETLTTIEKGISPFLFVWGFAWWMAAGFGDINRFVLTDGPYLNAARLMFIAVSVLLFSRAHFRMVWREAAWPQLALLPAMVLIAVATLADMRHLFGFGGWLAWPLAIGVHFWLLKVHAPDVGVDDEPVAGTDDELNTASTLTHYFAGLHAATMLLLAVIGAIELNWLMEEWGLARSAWSVAAVMLVPCSLLLWASSRAAETAWPVRAFPKSYWLYAGIPMVIALCLWSLSTNFTHDGQSSPLPYLPLINVIDLGHVFLLMTSIVWWRRVSGVPDIVASRPLFYVVASALGFIWLNAILLRTLHHWADVPFRFEAMIRSVLVQASLSIFWTVLALSLMLFAARSVRRGVWMVGAALMAVVVGKLLLVDLSHLAGVERIVSFIGVGMLMLVIGYVAPVPPAAGKKVQA